MKTIFIASDHGGFAGKQMLVVWLTSRGDNVHDLGPIRLDPNDDYPLAAAAVGQAVRDDPQSLGILLCRSGQGMAIVANKFPGVRATVAWNEPVACAARADDAANVLCLPTDYVSEAALRTIVAAFLATAHLPEPRFERRLREIRQIEEQTMRDSYKL